MFLKLQKEARGNDKDAAKKLAIAEELKINLEKGKLANEIKLDNDEMISAAKEFATAQFRQYGMNYVPDEYVDNYAKELLGKEDQYRKIADQLMEKKLLNIIRESMKVEDKEVSMDEFKALFD